MKRLRWTDLTPAERDELQTLIKAKGPHSAWEPDYDWLGFMILALPAAIAGVVVLGKMYGFGLSFGVFRGLFSEVGFSFAIRKLAYLAPLSVALWLTMFLIGNWMRRGYASTSFATIKVHGPKLVVIRHDDVERVVRRVVRTRHGSFTALELFDHQGSKLAFHTHGVFADAAIAAINRVRAEPVPIEA